MIFSACVQTVPPGVEPCCRIKNERKHLTRMSYPSLWGYNACMRVLRAWFASLSRSHPPLRHHFIFRLLLTRTRTSPLSLHRLGLFLSTHIWQVVCQVGTFTEILDSPKRLEDFYYQNLYICIYTWFSLASLWW